MCSIGALPLPTASSRPEKYDDRYRYDHRFTGSFDDEPEPPRDPYGEEVDRRSEHSEHSARSLRSAPSLQSRRSSFSAHSHQVGGGRLRGHLGSRGGGEGASPIRFVLPKSQVYRSHNVPSGSYEVPPPPGSFHGDYAYGPYGSDFHGAPGFPEYGYPAEASWPSVEQGVCARPWAHTVRRGPGAPGTSVCACGKKGWATTQVGTGDGRAWASLGAAGLSITSTSVQRCLEASCPGQLPMWRDSSPLPPPALRG